MPKVGTIEKKTNTPYLNFYEFEAIHRDGSISPYYVSSRAREIGQLKAVTHQNKPDGVILYGVYGDKKDKVVLIRQYVKEKYPDMIEVDVTCDCWGDIRRTKHFTSKEQWQKDLERGYFMA